MGLPKMMVEAKRHACSYQQMYNAESYMYQFWGFLKPWMKQDEIQVVLKVCHAERDGFYRTALFNFTYRLLKYSHWGFIRRVFFHSFPIIRIHTIQIDFSLGVGESSEWEEKERNTLSPRTKFISLRFSYQNSTKSKLLL